MKARLDKINLLMYTFMLTIMYLILARKEAIV